MGDSQNIRVLLVDDQALIRQGLCYIINSQADMTVVGEAGDGAEAVEVALQHAPDIILMDVQMPKMTGIEATRALRAAGSTAKVVLLTTFDVTDYVFDGIRAGAVGYLLKDAESEDLLANIRLAQQGAAIYASTNASAALAQAMTSGIGGAEASSQVPVAGALLEPLTEREIDVLQLMAYGQKNSEIAATLCLSEGTVKTHVHHILQKLGVDDRTQAVVLAMRQGLVT